MTGASPAPGWQNLVLLPLFASKPVPCNASKHLTWHTHLNHLGTPTPAPFPSYFLSVLSLKAT